ncbi:MAG: transcription elongation factor GreA [Clostridia bacterium]|nr:transcription elongation factor GreA [Clostridia bacterium]
MSEIRQLTFTDKMKLEAELAELIEAKKKVAEDIQTARGFGDLSENAEYDAAKAKEAEVYGNIHRIEQILRTANFVDDKAVSTDVVSLGNVVKVKDLEYDEIDEYTLVGFTEADPMKLFVSNESPIGEALMGASVGEIVEANTPGGKIRLEILAIRKR